MSYIVIPKSFQTIYSINYMVSTSRNSHKIADCYWLSLLDSSAAVKYWVVMGCYFLRNVCWINYNSKYTHACFVNLHCCSVNKRSIKPNMRPKPCTVLAFVRTFEEESNFPHSWRVTLNKLHTACPKKTKTIKITTTQ